MKNSSIENRFCMSLVAFAVIVRLLLATGAAAAVDEAFGRAPQAQAPEPDILTLEQKSKNILFISLYFFLRM